MTIKLHPHQHTAVTKMHNGCVLWGGVGTGKTITALAYSQMREAGKHIVVVTTAKKRDSGDWENEAALMQIHPDKLTVTSWNKIKEYEDTADQFFIFDEQRLVGSGAWVKSFYKVARKNNWILLSATPGDTWSDYAPMFIANGWYKNITEFRRTHAVYSQYAKFPKIERWLGEAKLRHLRDQLLVEMPMIRHTTRHMHYVECEYDHDKLDIVRKKRWNVYEDKPLKNAAELFGVMRKVVSSDISRTTALEQLIIEHPKLIVFYNYNYELEMMRDLLSQISSEGLTQHSMGLTGIQQSMRDWDTTKSGLVIPSTRVSEMPKDTSSSSDHRLPPWDLTQEEIASGQLVTTRRITSREDTTELWTESKTSTRSPRTKEAAATTPHLIQLPPSLSRQTSPKGPSHSTSSTSSQRHPSTELQMQQTDAVSTAEDEQSLTKMTKSRHAGRQPATSQLTLPSTSPTTGPSLSSKSWDIHEAQSSQLITETSQSNTQGEKSKPSLESSSLITSGNGSFGWAEWNGHKHQPIPDTDRWVYLVQYASGSEGWNCVETDAMAFWSLTYSWKQFNQAQGRIDRLNTPFEDLHYYAFMSNSPADKPVLRALEAKHDFQPSSVKM